MNAIAILGVVLAFVGLVVWLASRNRTERLQRATYIRTYAFPKLLRVKLAERYPQLSGEQLDIVFRGLRQYFQIAALRGGARAPSLGMPSKAVDEVWHDFILMSREYTAFCKKAFGGYFHHTPEGAMQTPMPQALGNTLATIRRFDAAKMGWMTLMGMPLLFAVDAALAIPSGYVHTQESLEALLRQQALSSASSCSGGSCASSSSSCCGDGGGGSSCGGGGCGGGCSS